MTIFGLLLTSATAFSQYNDYYNYNRLGRSNRDISRDYSSSSSQPSAEQIEKAKAKKIDEIIANLKTELTLDELQAIAIKNEIASSIKNIDIVSKKETSEEEKSKEIKALTDRTEITINSYLNVAQKEKYKAYDNYKIFSVNFGKTAEGIKSGKEDLQVASMTKALSSNIGGFANNLKELMDEREKSKEIPFTGGCPSPIPTDEEIEKKHKAGNILKLIEESNMPEDQKELCRRSLSSEFQGKYKNLIAEYFLIMAEDQGAKK